MGLSLVYIAPKGILRSFLGASMDRSAALFALVASSLPLVVTGCAMSGTSSSPIAHPGVVMKGKMQGGQQPVSGATIQLFAVGATNGSGATSLLKNPVTTDANGGFSITTDFDCPTGDPLVYLVATNGDPGMGGNNTAIGMMAALSHCSALTASTFVWVSEVTTVAAAAALAPYMTAPANVGAADQNALALAFQLAGEYADTTAGTSPGPGYSPTPTTYSTSVPTATINTLANILASCINSGGASSTQCTTLASLTDGSTDTLTAVVKIMQNPGVYDTTGLFALASPTGPFQPQLSAPPVATFGVSPQPPVTDSSPIFAFPSSVSTGDALWLVAKQYPPCLEGGSYTFILLNHSTFASGGTGQCGMVYSYVPSNVPSASITAEWLNYASNLTTVLNDYLTFVSVVPRPVPTYAFKPNAAFWEGNSTLHASYNFTVIFNNTTAANVTLGASHFSGTDAAYFKIANSYCENVVVNSSGGCSVDLTFLPPDDGFHYATFSMPVTDGSGHTSYITVQLGGSGQYH
jgi:hypothetical protein